jgi:S1-C subfamily serine protease
MRQVRPGDVVLKVNSDEVKTVAEYEAAIKAARTSGRRYMLLRLERRLGEDEIGLVTADIPLEP